MLVNQKQGFFGKIGGFFSNAFNTVKNAVTSVFNGGKAIVQGGIDKVSTVVQTLHDDIKGAVSTVHQDAVNTVSTLNKDVVGYTKDVKDTIDKTVGKAENVIIKTEETVGGTIDSLGKSLTLPLLIGGGALVALLVLKK